MFKIRLSLAYKLLIIVIAVAFLPSVISAVVVSKMVLARIEEGLQARTKESLRVTENIISVQLDSITAAARVVSELSDLKTALAKSDYKYLRRINKRMNKYVDNAFVEIFDSESKLLSRYEPLGTSIPAQGYTKPADFLLEGVKNYERISSVSEVNGYLFLQSATPIVDSTFQLLGGVVVTYPLDENFLSYVRRLTFIDLGIFLEDKLVYTSLENEGVPIKPYKISDEIKQKVLVEGENAYVTETIEGNIYSIAYAPLRDREETIDGIISVYLPKKQIVELQQSSRNFILFLALASAVLAILLSLIMSRGITRALGRLLQGVRAVSGGDLSSQIKLQSGDEFGEFSDAFDQMTKDLKKSRNALEEYSRTLEQKVEERTRELKNAQAQLIQSAKMAAVGQLAAGVAHEINNPMGAIISNMETLEKYFSRINNSCVVIREANEVIDKDKSKADKQLKELSKTLENGKLEYMLTDTVALIKDVLDCADRIKHIVANLSGFTHPASEKMVLLNVNDEINRALALVGNELRYKCEVVKEFGEMPMIMGNAGELSQVFVNMLINASQAIKERGKVTVKTLSKAESVVVQFIDTGVGIAPEQLSKIFEPFFTTKEVGKGTGLGLSIVYNIIEKHRGSIHASSKVGKGTTFTITFPVGEK